MPPYRYTGDSQIGMLMVYVKFPFLDDKFFFLIVKFPF